MTTTEPVDLDLLAEAIARESDPARMDALLALAEEELARDPFTWLRFLFPQYVSAPFAAHHEEFWAYVWGLRADAGAAPFLAVWARGGAKSSSVELACVALAARKVRRYVLYVSSTQEQADKHVASIAAMLESPRFAALYPALSERFIGKFGNPRGWRRNRLATADGFIIDAIGLDTAARGIRVEGDRPGVIVVDDLDDALDSPRVTQNKIDRLTRTILPMGTAETIIFGAQNIVIPNGIFARLAGVAEQPADFLTTAHVSGPVPALLDVVIEADTPDQTGRPRWKITSGTPTWAGQSVAACQVALDTFGKTAFLIELQHEAHRRSGGIFRAWDWMADQHVPDPFGEGPHIKRFRMWDTAGTEATGDNDPDWTAGVLLAYDTDTGLYRVEHVVRWRAASGTTKGRARATAIGDVHGIADTEDLSGADLDRVTFGIEEEPGWHGRDWAQEWSQDVLRGMTSHKIPAFGTKAERAEGVAGAMENGLVTIVRGDWNALFLAELEAFNGSAGQHDDQVDALAHAYNHLRRFGAVDSGTGLDAMRLSVHR